MGYARHIGRVGALAVAIGVGFGIAGPPGVAFADTGSETSSTPDEPSTKAPSNPLSTAVSSIVNDVLSGFQRVADVAKSGIKTPDSTKSDDPRTGIVQSSGGALTSRGKGPKKNTDATESEPNTDSRALSTSAPDTTKPAASDSPDTGSPVDAGPTQELGATSLRATALASPMVTDTPAPPKPATVVTGFVSSVLAWAGLSPDAGKTPTDPAESPAFLAVFAFARRQFGQAMSEGAAQVMAPMETSLAIAELMATPTYTLEKTIPIGKGPTGLGTSPDGTKVYVADRFTESVYVVDTSTNDVIATIPMGAGPNAVTVSPDGTRAYVGLHGTNQVATIDTATNQVIKTVKVGPGVTEVAVTPDGSRVYASNSSGSTVSVIDTATNTEITRVKVGSAPFGIAASPDGSKIYVANRSSGTVSVIDTATNTVVKTVKVGSSPRALAVTPDGAHIYVTNYGPDTVSVIDTSTNTVVKTVAVGKDPIGGALSPDGAYFYTANSNDTVTVIDTATNTKVASFSVDPKPETNVHHIAVAPDGTIYVTDYYDKAVRVISVT
jgi:YVTN family beta-propeller protein